MESNAVDWINEYLEWMDPGSGGISATPAVSADANTDFVSAYLEWMDYAPSVAAPAPARPATVIPRAPAWAGIDIARPEALREAILLMALRTESDCMHVLRQTIDAGDAQRAATDLAREALKHAERLIDDEQSAWNALNALYRCDFPRSPVTSQDDLDRQDWPHALESVMADVRALTGRVLALHTH